jgi:hypothetical protein
MSVHALGCVRLVASYLMYGRRASMTFAFRRPDGLPPSPADCRAVGDGYAAWENNGFGLGYTLLRSVDSNFVGTYCFTLDPRGGGSRYDHRANGTGQIPGILAGMIATGCSPIVRWATAERGEHSGRTYAVGLSRLLTQPFGDEETLAPLAGDTIAIEFSGLRSSVMSSSGLEQVILSARRSDVPTTLSAAHQVIGQGCYSLLGSQRRRTRPSA